MQDIFRSSQETFPVEVLVIATDSVACLLRFKRKSDVTKLQASHNENDQLKLFASFMYVAQLIECHWVLYRLKSGRIYSAILNINSKRSLLSFVTRICG